MTSWEIASELSYLFWQTTPDDELLTLAANDELLDPNIVSDQVDRLLNDQRSADAMLSMSDQWLSLKRLSFIARDAVVYGELTDEIRASMATETSWFISESFQQTSVLTFLLTNVHILTKDIRLLWLQ